MRNTLFFLLAVSFFSSCSSVKITSDKDGSVDFDQHKTLSYYGWAEESDKLLNRFEKERIETAFGKEFANRGIRVVENGSDIIVSLFIVVDQKRGATAYTNHFGGGGYGYGAGWGLGMGHSTTTYNEYDYYVGTLVCDVFDASTKKLIWQGVVSGEIDDNPKTRERNTPRVIKELMKRYPKKPIE